MEQWLNVPKMPCPELVLDGNEVIQYNELMARVRLMTTSSWLG